ncbi:hypothetical protein SLEP1_g41767 [Rubroshorea leprosula]|uniref:CCHC-type domain-containing protein n=1 Tax=Rubroshorea leprosula TaxID=152421 RepID=A0AAV5L8Y5_9ROSI|nr:hypothetical protein SLEP1_g41767 [Rubroshorea leprosula]
MVQFLFFQPLESLSTTRPPFFDGTNYNYWKNMIKVFMLANVPTAWIVTIKDPYVPMKVVGEREVPKEEVEWNDEDLGKIMINNKAINMLQCALNPTEFHRVSKCDTAKEMWDMLEVTHEETSQVKESKINRLIYMYELFKMKPEESIQDMYTRLNDIVTNLKALGKVYPSQEVMRKVLRSLPKNRNGGVEIVEKKKDVAFKAGNQKEKSEDDASDGENISTLIFREVRRFMKKNIKSKLAKRDEGESTKRSVKCYECNKMGHYRNECLNLKKGKKSMKKRAFAATWSDDETSSTESESSLEKGVANLCFMAQKDSYNDEEINSNFSSSINESSFEYSYDDLCKVLDCSMNDIKKLRNDNIALTKTITLLRNEIESLSKQNEVLVKENASLNGEIASLKNEESNNALKKENEDLKKGNEDLKKENEASRAGSSLFKVGSTKNPRVFSLYSTVGSRVGSKRRQVGSSSIGGQAQEEEGNISQLNLFLDTQASTKYESIKNMAVLSCNCVKFSQFPQQDMRVEQIFRELGWKDYVEVKEHVYYEVVHQIYANLKPRGNKCKTMVAGVSFQFSPKDICAVLDIPEGGDDEFLDVNHALVRATIAPNCTENQIKVGSLSPENRALRWIISCIIAQRKGSKSYVLTSDLPWFDYFLNEKRVNPGRFIFRSIIKPYSPTTGLPHGALITRLVKRNNIDLTSFRFGTVPGGTTLTKASFEKMDCLFRNGIWIKKGEQEGEQEGDEEEGDTDQEIAEQGAEEHEDDSPRPFRASMQRTNCETMEVMISEMQQLHTDFYGFRTEMRGRMTNVEGKLDRLVNYFFPPPPPDAT